MTKITKKANKFKFVEMFEGYFKVIDREKETYPVTCEVFQTYLEDSKIIGYWHCQATGENGEDTLSDFFKNPAQTINKEINNFMKNDYFSPAPENLKTVCNWGLVKSIWASSPFPQL